MRRNPALGRGRQPRAWLRPPPAAATCGPWLAHAGSLTAALRGTFGAFEVEVVREGLGDVSPQEAHALGLAGRRRAWRREVMLRAGPLRLVVARSIAAPADVAGAWQALAVLGPRPLGEWLFRDPRVERLSLWSSRVPAGDPLAAAARAHAPEGVACWARRSLFRRAGRLLLVSELLLPPLATTLPGARAAR